MKLSSALKKEFMFFSRTFRMFGVIFAIMIFALADPVLIKGTGMMMSAMGDMVSEQAEATGEEAMFTEEDLAVFDMFENMDASAMMAMSIGDFTSTAVLIVLLIMMGPSGSEQKKRSIIIPRCAGLTPKMYVTPKFILYPLTGFLSGFLGMFLCAGVTLLVFEGTIDIAMLTLAAVSVGLYISFVMILQLTLGICTERPGVAVISVLAAVNVIPTLLTSFRVDKFNPFALPSIAQNAFSGQTDFEMLTSTAELDPVNVAVSLIVTVVLSLILYFTTLFVLTTRQIENEGNEAVL